MLNKKNTISAMCVLIAMLMVLLSVALPVSAESEKITSDSTVQIPVNPENKIDSVLKEKMATASPEEKIPVAIWYTDVDQAQIDTLTAEKVDFSVDEVADDYEMPSTTLLNNLKEGQDGADAQMQAYLERTKKQRESERKRTDEYIMTRREFSRAKYNEKSAKLIKDIQLNEADITFNSQYAPMIEFVATKSTIQEIAESMSVISIYYASKSGSVENIQRSATDSEGDLVELKQTIGYDKVIDKFDLSGQGINIGMYESGGNLTSKNTEVPRDRFITVGPVVAEGHVDNTASILIGSVNGFAKNATVYSTTTAKQYIESMITTYNIKLINVSLTCHEYFENWVNHLMAYHSVTVVASAGNIIQTGINVAPPARFSNVIAVGCYDMKNTVSLEDDILSGCAYEEITGGVDKPDVIMPGNVLGGATSSSAPVLSACIALMFELKPSIAVHPQAVKAIVLASCDRKVNPSADGEEAETMEQGLTERQGAGAPNIWNMACIVSNGNYGVGIINSSSTQDTRRFILPSYGSSYANVSVAWIKENLHEEDYSTSNPAVTDASGVNLGLSVYRGLSAPQLVKSSNLQNSSTEMVYFQLDTDQNYEMRVIKPSTATVQVRYGYAYSVNDPMIYRDTGDELCYIKNYHYGTYLTLDPTTGETSLQPFSGNDTQKWVLDKVDTNTYNFVSGYVTDGLDAGKMTTGDNINSSVYKAVISSALSEGVTAADMGFQLLSNETGIDMKDGATALFYPDPNKGRDNYILTCSSGKGAFVKCSSEEAISDYRSWVLEKLNYMQGDTDLNGSLNIKDATLIRKHLSDVEFMNNIGYVLADVNYDGSVNIRDATYIQSII